MSRSSNRDSIRACETHSTARPDLPPVLRPHRQRPGPAAPQPSNTNPFTAPAISGYAVPGRTTAVILAAMHMTSTLRLPRVFGFGSTMGRVAPDGLDSARRRCNAALSAHTLAPRLVLSQCLVMANQPFSSDRTSPVRPRMHLIQSDVVKSAQPMRLDKPFCLARVDTLVSSVSCIAA